MGTGKNKQEINEFIATFYEILFINVQNVCHSFQCTALIIPNRSLMPVESFLMNKLMLLMEEMPLETQHGIFFKHNGVPPHFGHQVMAYLNQHYESH
jgi:hypothetical protein